MPPLPLVASFYWKGQVCPRGKAKLSVSSTVCQTDSVIKERAKWMAALMFMKRVTG